QQAFGRGKDEIALFAEAHIGLGPEFCLEIADELESEARQRDVLRRRELLADAPRRACRAGIGIGRILLEDCHRAAESVLLEIIGDRAPDYAAADDHHIILPSHGGQSAEYA